MKNKIFSKLFKYADLKSWYKNGSTYYSDYYFNNGENNSYKLEYICNDLAWTYKVYRKDKWTDSKLYEGIVTLNKGGKTLFIITICIVTAIGLSIYGAYTKKYLLTNLKFDLLFLMFSYLLSFFAFSIFNWSIYRKFRKVQYYVKNSKKILEKERDDLLEEEIIQSINLKISKDPKLARKIKLQELEKKSFFSFSKKQKNPEL